MVTPYVWPYPRLVVWILCVILGVVLQAIITANTEHFAARLALPVLSTVPIFAGFLIPFVTDAPAGVLLGAVYNGFAVALPGVFALVGTVLGFWLGCVLRTLRAHTGGKKKR